MVPPVFSGLWAKLLKTIYPLRRARTGCMGAGNCFQQFSAPVCSPLRRARTGCRETACFETSGGCAVNCFQQFRRSPPHTAPNQKVGEGLRRRPQSKGRRRPSPLTPI